MGTKSGAGSGRAGPRADRAGVSVDPGTGVWWGQGRDLVSASVMTPAEPWQKLCWLEAVVIPHE